MAGEAPAQGALVRTGAPRAGATPGTEEWVAILRGRSFSLRTRFAAIRAEPDRQRRRALIDAIAADSRREQQAFADHVVQLGGRVLRHHWLFHGCTIEIPRDRLGALRDHPFAAVLCPNEERKPSSVRGMTALSPFLPIGAPCVVHVPWWTVAPAHLRAGHHGVGSVQQRRPAHDRRHRTMRYVCSLVLLVFALLTSTARGQQATTGTFGFGCGHPLQPYGTVLSYTGTPRFGATFTVNYQAPTWSVGRIGVFAHLLTGSSNTSLLGIPLPINAWNTLSGWVGAPHCMIWTSSDWYTGFTAGYPQGQLQVTVPADPSLVGVRLYQQWMINWLLNYQGTIDQIM